MGLERAMSGDEANAAVLQMPLRPTWRRYISIFWKSANISIYRALEYEALSHLSYAGRILDFGGGEKAHYAPALKSWIQEGRYESVNISKDMQPTFLVEPGRPMDLPVASFDMVVSVNTLEHVFDLHSTLVQLIDCLRPGGRIVLAVPFLYRVHGCPDDYNRPTASWWEITLQRLGMTHLRITPLAWDFMTSGLSITESAGPLKKLRRALVPLYGWLYACLKAPAKDERYPLDVGSNIANVALGYVITGIKR